MSGELNLGCEMGLTEESGKGLLERQDFFASQVPGSESFCVTNNDSGPKNGIMGMF